MYEPSAADKQSAFEAFQLILSTVWPDLASEAEKKFTDGDHGERLQQWVEYESEKRGDGDCVGIIGAYEVLDEDTGRTLAEERAKRAGFD